MGNTCLLIAALLYLGVAVDYSTKGQIWMAVAFAAYAVANVAFIMVNRGG